MQAKILNKKQTSHANRNGFYATEIIHFYIFYKRKSWHTLNSINGPRGVGSELQTKNTRPLSKHPTSFTLSTRAY